MLPEPKKTRSSVHRKIPRRFDHEDTPGRRRCEHPGRVRFVTWAGPRRSRRVSAAQTPRRAARKGSDHGPRLRRRQDQTNRSRAGLQPRGAPDRNRRNPWRLDRAKYAKRNEIERFFHRLKNWRRIATRYDKLNAAYTSFINLALIHTALTLICHGWGEGCGVVVSGVFWGWLGVFFGFGGGFGCVFRVCWRVFGLVGVFWGALGRAGVGFGRF